MKLKDISEIHSGYITRKKIESSEKGSHYLVQAKNVNGERLTCNTKNLIRFNATLSRTDRLLERRDLLFMARGANNFTIQLDCLPKPALAAACFFIIRVADPQILPGYLCWYLNQSQVKHYLVQHSGRSVHMPVVRRAVLENIEVPVPDIQVQSNIDEVNALMSREIDLLQQLGEKRASLITAACLQVLNDF